MIEFNVNKTFRVGEVVAIADPNLRLPSFFLREQKRPAKPREPLTLSHYEEKRLPPTVVDSKGNPIERIHFGFSECCADCREGKTHFFSDKSMFYSVFASMEDLTDPRRNVLQPALPFGEAKKKEPKEEAKKVEGDKVPQEDVLEVFNDI